jgi:RimJ/RimL family protein N-acetyltransferase
MAVATRRGRKNLAQHLERRRPPCSGAVKTEASPETAPASARTKSRIRWLAGRVRLILHKIAQPYRVYCIDLNTYEYPSTLRHDLVIRPAGPDEFRQMAQDPIYEIGPYELEDSLQIMGRGDQCWVAELEGQIGFYTFVQYENRFFSPGCQVKIAPDAVYLFRTVTLAHLRGRQLAPSTVGLLALKLRADGYARMFTDISTSNNSSLRYADNAGFKRIGSFIENTLGKRRRVLFSRRLKRIISQPPD